MSEKKEDITLPFIEGENISLCAINLDHISLYVAWMNNPKIRKYMRYNIPKTIEEVKKNLNQGNKQLKIIFFLNYGTKKIKNQ